MVLEKNDMANHADQRSFVNDWHGAELIERQEIRYLVKRRVR